MKKGVAELTRLRRVAERHQRPDDFARLAAGYTSVGSFRDAWAAAWEALNLDQACIKAWVELGKAQRALGVLDEALKSLSYALQLNRQNVEALVALSETMVLMGDNERARALLLRAHHEGLDDPRLVAAIRQVGEVSPASPTAETPKRQSSAQAAEAKGIIETPNSGNGQKTAIQVADTDTAWEDLHRAWQAQLGHAGRTPADPTPTAQDPFGGRPRQLNTGLTALASFGFTDTTVEEDTATAQSPARHAINEQATRPVEINPLEPDLGIASEVAALAAPITATTLQSPSDPDEIWTPAPDLVEQVVDTQDLVEVLPSVNLNGSTLHVEAGAGQELNESAATVQYLDPNATTATETEAVKPPEAPNVEQASRISALWTILWLALAAAAGAGGVWLLDQAAR